MTIWFGGIPILLTNESEKLVYLKVFEFQAGMEIALIRIFFVDDGSCGDYGVGSGADMRGIKVKA